MELNLKIAICDDDGVFAADIERRVSKMCNDRGIEHSIDVMTDPSSLLIDERTPYDIIFLDVDMGEYNGIDVARHIRQYDSSLIIVYISWHIKYSPLGYKVEAFRYLLKSDLDSDLEDTLNDICKEYLSRPECLTIRSGAGNVEIKVADITYIESQRNVVEIHLVKDSKDGKPIKGGKRDKDVETTITSNETLQSIEKRLSPKTFLKIQRSFIVNLLHVKEFKSYKVWFADGFTITTNRSEFQGLQQKFLLWKGR